MADLTTSCQPDGGLALFHNSWLIGILPPNSLCKAMPCSAGDTASWAHDHYLHGGIPALLLAMLFISIAFAAGAWFNGCHSDPISPEEDEAQMAYLRAYCARVHREATDA
ncbi:hypothetical protein [Novosphingobium rosa]|uniref:hypothetical protein n=1 Tax=Novosphingobium rosa TaxID=76978 RepID=UPI000830C3EC|nr:hypothetical protein [Novosphingobium rosa]